SRAGLRRLFWNLEALRSAVGRGMEQRMTTRGSASTTFDPWYDHYADRASGLSASEVRALFAVASRPEVVSLAGGMPYVSALPTSLISSALERVMRDHGAQALQYGSGQGTPELREHILEVMALEGIRGRVDDVVVTTGSQQALDLVTKLFIDPGDVILAEAPSYVGAIGVFRSYQAEVAHVMMDEDGLIPQALREAIARLQAEGKRIKFLYTIPTFHNPAGVTLTWERRLEILEICKANDILVLEDNPYGLLYFDTPPPHAMRSIEEDGVIYLGSFSKTFAPGFRVGWALAPHAIREKLILANESATLCPSSFSQFAITAYLRSSDWKGQSDAFRDVSRSRRAATLTALQEHLPGEERTVPDGLQPVREHGIPPQLRLEGPDRRLPRRLPLAARRHAHRAAGAPARNGVDRAQRWLLCVAAAARDTRFKGNAAPGGQGARRV